MAKGHGLLQATEVNHLGRLAMDMAPNLDLDIDSANRLMTDSAWK